MMGHTHGGPGELDAGWPASGLTRRLLFGGLGAAIVLTLIGAVLLWPTGSADVDTTFLGDVELRDATVREVSRETCSFGGEDDSFQCDQLTLEITSGPEDGEEVSMEMPLGPGVVELEEGDRIVLTYEPELPPGSQYQFADYQRRTPLLWLAALFALVVVALGRLRGVMALVGLGVSVLVLVVFVLPSLLRGNDPLAVALVGSALVAFPALYLAHGVNARTTVALLGTFASLLLTGVLAAVFVGAANFTGFAEEEAGILNLTAGSVDIKGLLLAGVIIGSLGVLDDVTVTQVSAVGQLHLADPTAGPRALYRRALAIGRDHIASTVNTLVLAYAGAALPLLLLFTETGRPFGDVVNGEIVAVEIVRTLVGSIGLVASVPITTALAVAVIARRDRPPTSEPVEAEVSRPARWDDFSPPDDLSL